jgi:hypothetical protein
MTSWWTTSAAAAGALALGLVSGDAEAWSSMRCGNDLVTVGDTLYEVRATCGEPDQLDAYVEYRTVRQRERHCSRDDDGEMRCRDVIVERTIEVPMHRATYDFGRNRFINYLTFERGQLRHVATGSYGKKPRS